MVYACFLLIQEAFRHRLNKHYALRSKPGAIPISISRRKHNQVLFSSGKYFILILLVDTIGAEVLTWLSQENKLNFLETTQTITNGGGYTLMLDKDRKQIFMPEAVKLWDLLRTTDFTNRTNQALGDSLSI